MLSELTFLVGVLGLDLLRDEIIVRGSLIFEGIDHCLTSCRWAGIGNELII